MRRSQIDPARIALILAVPAFLLAVVQLRHSITAYLVRPEVEAQVEELVRLQRSFQQEHEALHRRMESESRWRVLSYSPSASRESGRGYFFSGGFVLRIRAASSSPEGIRIEGQLTNGTSIHFKPFKFVVRGTNQELHRAEIADLPANATVPVSFDVPGNDLVTAPFFSACCLHGNMILSDGEKVPVWDFEGP